MEKKADELRRITRETLGEGPGKNFYSKADLLLDEAEGTNSSLHGATEKIESLVRLFVGVEDAARLAGKYKEFFRKNVSYL